MIQCPCGAIVPADTRSGIDDARRLHAHCPQCGKLLSMLLADGTVTVDGVAAPAPAVPREVVRPGEWAAGTMLL